MEFVSRLAMGKDNRLVATVKPSQRQALAYACNSWRKHNHLGQAQSDLFYFIQGIK